MTFGYFLKGSSLLAFPIHTFSTEDNLIMQLNVSDNMLRSLSGIHIKGKSKNNRANLFRIFIRSKNEVEEA